ncbi:outer membrane protein assembly factor BamA, partial [Pelagibacteraceae bacterium]|nr:outer membrane protein assembly factor BamA [Pelagibacteraceae bacterium]
NLKAEVVNKFNIQGNERISSETIKIYGDLKENKNYSESDLNKILKDLYETEFFENINLEIKNNELNIIVNEYPYINQLIIIGEKTKRYTNQIREIIKLKEKRSLIKSYINSDINIIKSLYSSLGYNNVEINIKTKKITNNSYDLLVEIQRGEKTRIKSINFIGNNKISNRRLKDVIASEKHQFWKILSKNINFSESLLELDTRLLTNFYKSSGFYDVKINSKFAKINESKEAELFFSIDEGNRYTINKISTNVDSVFDKKIFFPMNDIYQKYIGEYYSPFKVKKLLDDLDKLIDKNNLQFVEHNVQEQIEEKSINIILNIYEGEKKLIERINVLGNSVTNEEVIRSELIIDEGDPFSNLNLEKSIAQIKARNIFRKVDYEVLDGSIDNLKVINIKVEEQPTGEVTAGAGIGSDGGLFQIGIKENNWLGTGKSVSFDLELESESISGILNYVDPNYDLLGNSLSYTLLTESNDKPDQGYENTLTSAAIATAFEQYKNVYLSLGLSASYDDLRTDSSASANLQKQDGSYNDISGNYSLSFDSRDRVFMPTSGSILKFGQTLPLFSDSASLVNNFSASKYASLNENVVGVGKFYLSTISALGTDDVRLSRRKGLSTRRLRGFQKNKIGPVDGSDHIGGNYTAALNLETNLPNLLPDDTNTDISAFLDFGNVWGVDYDSSIDDSNKIRSSTGVVANWLSPLGPINFVLSQNLSKADSDKTQSFSFNLGTTF